VYATSNQMPFKNVHGRLNVRTVIWAVTMSVTLVCQREGRTLAEPVNKVVRRFDPREMPATGGLRNLNSECIS